MKKKVTVILFCLAVTSIFSAAFFYGFDSDKQSVYADTGDVQSTLNKATIEREITDRRTKFTKTFSMSDGTYTAAVYSMPINYKKNGKWKEIDTSLVKSSSKSYYKTKSTSLSIMAGKSYKSNSLIRLKRSTDSLSWTLTGLNAMSKKAKKKASTTVENPRKTSQTDLLNENQITYKNVRKNITAIYQIYPEKITEILQVNKKTKNRSIQIKLNPGKLKVKVEKGRVYFKNKKGKAKYARLATIVTDKKGVSTSKVKVTYNKKKHILTLKVNKKWWDNSKRTFPVQIRAAIKTDQHERDVNIGTAYRGTPKANYTYQADMLLKADKCYGYVKMKTIKDLYSENVAILSAALNIENKSTIDMGAAKTFDIDIHTVNTKWSPKSTTYKNRPGYDENKVATIQLQKKGNYRADITDVVKNWYGKNESKSKVMNNGVALVANAGNEAYQTKLSKYPYFTIRYDMTGFEGAAELKENTPIKRDVVKAGQENYYYFEPEKGIAYELYTSNSDNPTQVLDTQGTLYSAEKNRMDFDENSGYGNNFMFIKSFDGKTYVRVKETNDKTGNYTITLKRRFAIPVLTGKEGEDCYIIRWNPIEKAKEYLVKIYDKNGLREETVVTSEEYTYRFTNETRDKTIAFTVTPRESEVIQGEASRKIYNTNRVSDWNYVSPMKEYRENFSAVTGKDKIYVLGGESKSGATNTFEVYDTKKDNWSNLKDFPLKSVCNSAIISTDDSIYTLGGRADTTGKGTSYSAIYKYNLAADTWSKVGDLPSSAYGSSAVLYRKNIYLFSKIGETLSITEFNTATNEVKENIFADKSDIIHAFTLDGRILLLCEKNQTLKICEYDVETSGCEEISTGGQIGNVDYYQSGTVIDGRIYINSIQKTDKVLYYDVYVDEWGEVSALNLKKENSVLCSQDHTLYSIGGFMEGFGTLDVVERYETNVETMTREIAAEQGQFYEIQLNGGKLNKTKDYVVTIRMDADVLSFSDICSYATEEELKEGIDGVKLLYCNKSKGVMVLRVDGSLEAGNTIEAYQSLTVEALQSKKTTVNMQVQTKEEKGETA